jgi:PAS domain S-box-containing protein
MKEEKGRNIAANAERSNAVINSVADPIFVKDVKHTWILLNDAFCSMVGHPREKLIGKSDYDFFPKAQADVFWEKDEEVFRTGKENVNEESITHASGKVMIIVTKKTLFKDSAGNKIIVGIIRDVTEQKQLEEQLQQSQKMEAIGNLAGGIAHDFNNILNVIIGYSDILLLDFQKHEKKDLQARYDVEEIRKAAKHAAHLTMQLLAFSRKQQLRATKVSLNHVISDMEIMLRRLIGETIQLEMKLDAGLKQVLADIGQCEQVLMNMVVNAKDAMPKGGKLLLKTENMVVSEDDAAMLAEGIKPGEYTCFSVIDTGIGMSNEVKARIFEPFFTTKPAGKGSGLGLSVVYGIVKQHGGWIDVETQPGKGSKFKVCLPVIVGKEENKPPDAPVEQEFTGNGERILLVEDEIDIRKLVARVLKENNYSVFDAPSAEEAEIIFENEGGKFDLLFTDSVLPGKSGVALAKVLLAQKHSLKIIVSSGYLDDQSQWTAIQEKGYPFLKKPFGINELLNIIGKTLKAK